MKVMNCSEAVKRRKGDSSFNGLRLKVILKKRRFKQPMKAKNTINTSIETSCNFIEIFRPRGNLDMQFSELYSQPS